MPRSQVLERDVLRDFGFKAWGTPPGQTGGVYPFLGQRNAIPSLPQPQILMEYIAARDGLAARR